MNKFRKQFFLKIAIGLGGLAVLVTAMFFLSSDINRRVGQIQNQKSELLSRTQTIEALASLKSDFEKAKPNLGLLESMLPPKDQLITFSKDLEVLARQNLVDLGFAFGSETPSKEGEPGFLNFTLTASGAFDQIAGFLKSVSESRYFVSFISIDLNKKDSVYSGNLSGKVFSQ